MNRRIMAIALVSALSISLFAGCEKDEGIQEVTEEPANQKVIEDLAFNFNLEDAIEYENGGVIYFSAATELNEHQVKFMKEYETWTDDYIKSKLGDEVINESEQASTNIEEETTAESSIVIETEDMAENEATSEGKTIEEDDTEDLIDMDEDEEEVIGDEDAVVEDDTEEAIIDGTKADEVTVANEESVTVAVETEDEQCENNKIKPKEISADWYYVPVSSSDYYIINKLFKYCDMMYIQLTTESVMNVYNFQDHDGAQIKCSSTSEADRIAKKKAEIEIDFCKNLILAYQDVTLSDEEIAKNKENHKVTLTAEAVDGMISDTYIYYAESDAEYNFLENYFKSAHKVTGMYTTEADSTDFFIKVWYDKPMIDSNITNVDLTTTEDTPEMKIEAN